MEAVKVDPAGLVAVAQRIAAAVAGLTAGEPVHPPLAGDDTSSGAAACLSAAGAALAAAIDEQVAALSATAAQLEEVAAGFSAQEALNAAGVGKLNPPGQAGVSGWAGPAPTLPPDVRPPLAPAGVLPGEVIARLLTAGSSGAGSGFIAGWTRLADACDEAAGVLRSEAADLPETWHSRVATPVVRDHLLRAAEALRQSGVRARGLAEQARAHSGQYAQAAHDVPQPAEFDALNEQLRQVSAANVNGRYAGVLASLMAKKASLEGRARQVHARYHSETEGTTSADGAGAPDDLSDLRGRAPIGGGRRFGDLPQGLAEPGERRGRGSDVGAAPVGPTAPVAQDGSEAPGSDTAHPPGVPPAAAGPAQAGQLASMIPTMLGAAGGAVGGAVSAIAKIPETLMQAGSQAAQELSGLMSHAGGPDVGAGRDDAHDAGLSGGGAGGGAGGGGTAPAGGQHLSPVMPSTGATTQVPPVPTGALPPPAEPATGAPGGMMAMPMGAMMPRGGGDGPGSDRPAKPKKLVVPPEPHAESVTGKVTDRIAKSAAAASKEPKEPEPPDDNDPPRGGEADPLRRLRIRNVTARADDSDS
jgi:hypothetical protein